MYTFLLEGVVLIYFRIQNAGKGNGKIEHIGEEKKCCGSWCGHEINFTNLRNKKQMAFALRECLYYNNLFPKTQHRRSLSQTFKFRTNFLPK
jgi:hypothetical protein